MNREAIPIRLLPYAAADGPTNMASDEVLLERAAELGAASLRFYTWSEPTLSLGYFQSAAIRESDSLTRSLPWVRRATGGAAIVHHHELTYAIALPPRFEKAIGPGWICRFHRLLSGILHELELSSQLVACGEEAKTSDLLCFHHHTVGDLVIAGSKVAGSAQRKWKGALLQHGSLLLDRSPFAPSLPGINESSLREKLTPISLMEMLLARLQIEQGWSITPSNWSEEEWDRIAEIRGEKYGNVKWNKKR